MFNLLKYIFIIIRKIFFFKIYFIYLFIRSFNFIGNTLMDLIFLFYYLKNEHNLDCIFGVANMK